VVAPSREMAEFAYHASGSASVGGSPSAAPNKPRHRRRAPPLSRVATSPAKSCACQSRRRVGNSRRRSRQHRASNSEGASVGSSNLIPWSEKTVGKSGPRAAHRSLMLAAMTGARRLHPRKPTRSPGRPGGLPGAAFPAQHKLAVRIIEGRKEMVEQIGPDDTVDAFDVKTFGKLAHGKRCNWQVLNGPVADGE
jgi:hypothetical protein